MARLAEEHAIALEALRELNVARNFLEFARSAATPNWIKGTSSDSRTAYA
jgi:hypothetical protein